MPRLVAPVVRLRPVLRPLALALALAACPRPPTSTPPPPVDDTREVVALETFVQDRPAIGGKWYEYNVDGHILEPKDEAWIVRRPAAGGDAFSAFAITSIYDDESGDSGVFSLTVAHRIGDAWSAARPFTASTNVKDTDSSVCVDLGDDATAPAEVDCAGDPWQLRFSEQSRLSVFAGFSVKEPAVFLADDVTVARVDVVRGEDGGVDLAALPDPTTPAALAPADAAFDNTDWDFAAFAPDLPQNGLALGRLARVAGTDVTLVDGGRGLVEFTVAAVADAATPTLRFSLRRTEIDFETFTVPAARGDFVDVDVALNAAGPTFLSLKEPDAKTPPADLVGVTWPLALPASRLDDIVVFVDDDGEPRLVLSPATALAIAASD